MLNATLERRRVQYCRCLRSLAALALTWVAITNAAAQDKSPIRSFDIVAAAI